MTTLRERKEQRRAVLEVLYSAVEDNRPDVGGTELRENLRVPERDLAAACTYLADEGLITVEWTTHNTPAVVALTHQGIRLMEADEEERG